VVSLSLSVYLGILSGVPVRFVSLCISGGSFWGTGSLCFSLYIWGFFLGYWCALSLSVYLGTLSGLLVRFVCLGISGGWFWAIGALCISLCRYMLVREVNIAV
jgi:hypothetical protein